MKHLLIWTVVSACLLGFVPGAVAQDESSAERASRRAEERAAREQERARRAQERVQERMRRAQERLERRLDWSVDDDSGAHILFAQDYELAEGSTASEKVVVIGGNATINGHAEDDVVVVGGTVRLGPKSMVNGDVSVVGGELDRDPASQVDGEVHVARISVPWRWAWGWGWPITFPNATSIWWDGVQLAFTLGRFVVVLLLSSLFVLVAPRWMHAVATRLVTAPGVSLAAGFAGEILFAPAMICLAVVLIITIVGIPFLAGLPLLAGAFALTWVGGYAAVTGLIGARLRGADWFVHGLRPVDVFIGSCVLSSITFVGQVLMLSPGWLAPFAMFVRGTGWTIEYIGWTIGLGAALIAWLRPGNGFNPGAVPPAVPPLPSPSPSAL